MNTEWREVTLGEICDLNSGSVFPRALQGKISGEYPFAKVSDMNLAENAICIRNANNWVDEQDLSLLKAKPIPSGATVFAKIGEALKQNRLRFLVQPTIVDNNMMGVIPLTDHVIPRFLYYALSQFDFGEVAGGTALPYLTMRDISALNFNLPPLPEQRAIAHILGTLDDKIELNRKMNRTLEEMARALFKDWFVDFGPTRAKIAGREPYLPAEVWDLFPDRLAESELGEIPAGWAVKPLKECFNLTMGQSPPGHTYNDEGNGLPFFQGRTDFGFRYPENRRYCTDPKLDFVHSGGVSQRFYKSFEQGRGDFHDIGFPFRQAKSLRRSPHMMTRQCDCVTERRFGLCVPGSGSQSSRTLPPQQLSGECNPGEQSQQQWGGTRYGEV